MAVSVQEDRPARRCRRVVAAYSFIAKAIEDFLRNVKSLVALKNITHTFVNLLIVEFGNCDILSFPNFPCQIGLFVWSKVFEKGKN